MPKTEEREVEGTEGRREKPAIRRGSERGTGRKSAERSLGTASHVATVATYSRARACIYIFIATGALSAELIEKEKERKTGRSTG